MWRAMEQTRLAMPRGSLLEYFDALAARGAEPAVVHRAGYRRVRTSYGQIAATANRFACELERRGVARGDRVFLWGGNSAEWISAFWGCVLRGAVVIPMDAAAPADFAGRVARESAARLVVAGRELHAAALGVPLLELESLPATLEKHPARRYGSPPLAPGDMLEIIFTSGATAEPRGVVLTHGNLLSSLEPLETEIQKYIRYERWVHPLRFLELLPLSHVFGQLMAVFIPLLLGATVIFPETLGPAGVLHAIRRERVSVLVTVPRLLEALRDKVERDLEAAGRLEQFRRDYAAASGRHFFRRWWRFRSLHRVFGWKFWAFISGGAALPAAVEEFWTRTGFAVIQGYGLTETASLVSVNHPFRLSHGSIGRVLPGHEVRLAPDGEILVRAGSVAAGYWEAGQLRSALDSDGWFHTGDFGERDAAGNLYFKGRRKNVIVTPAGMNVYPEDLEAALRARPAIRDCVVFGAERDGNAEPFAVLLLRDSSDDGRAVIDGANARLAEYQQIRRWFVWPEFDFPRTPSQKPRLAEIRERVLGELQSGAPKDRLKGLSEFLARLSGARGGTARTLGEMDSLDRVELLGELEERYQIELDESAFSEAGTFEQLAPLLRQPPLPSQQFDYPRWPLRGLIRLLRALAYRLLVWPAVMLLARPRIQGRKNLQGVRGPAIVICNHVTEKDAGFLLAALPGHLRRRMAIAMNGERLRALRHPTAENNWLLRRYRQFQYFLLVTIFNVFPMPQHSGHRESFLFAGELADGGWSLMIFPEGRISPDGAAGEFRLGIGVLASQLGLPVIPARLDGLYELREAKRRFAPRGAITVSLGPPRRFSPENAPDKIAQELREAVLNLP